MSKYDVPFVEMLWTIAGIGFLAGMAIAVLAILAVWIVHSLTH